LKKENIKEREQCREEKTRKKKAKMDYKYRMTVKKSRHNSKKNGYRTKVQREKRRINKE
jgi:hypothetical protein